GARPGQEARPRGGVSCHCVTRGNRGRISGVAGGDSRPYGRAGGGRSHAGRTDRPRESPDPGSRPLAAAHAGSYRASSRAPANPPSAVGGGAGPVIARFLAGFRYQDALRISITVFSRKVIRTGSPGFRSASKASAGSWQAWKFS